MRRNVRALAAIGSAATMLMLAGCAGSVADTTWRGAPAGVELGVDMACVAGENATETGRTSEIVQTPAAA